MAKRNALSSSISMVGHFTRNNLERMGALLDTVNSKSSKARKYDAVDLGKEAYQRDLFSDQTLKATQQLLGTTFLAYLPYVAKRVPISCWVALSVWSLNRSR